MCMIRSGNVWVTGHDWMCQRLGDVRDWMGQCMGDYVHDGMGDYVHDWMGQRLSDYVHDWMGQRMGDCGMGRRGEATGRERHVGVHTPRIAFWHRPPNCQIWLRH